MSGKGVVRLLLLVFTALVGAGLTLGALKTPADLPRQEHVRPAP
ncbi:hypothetical protein [Terricaulis sp.]